MAAMLDDAAARWPDGEAIVFGEERITFAAFRARADALARGLAALGIGHGDRVALWLPNRPLWFVAQYACARLGAIVVALNPRYRGHELAYVLRQSGATALLVTDHLGPTDYLEILSQVVPELPMAVPGELASASLPELRHVVVDAEDPYPGCLRVLDLCEATAPLPSRGPSPDDVYTILYTSGTTAFPKGAMISHANCVPHTWNCGRTLGVTPADRVLHTLPAAGTWGGVNIPLTTWSHGATLVLVETFEALRVLALIEREGCTIWNAVDAMVQAVLDHPQLDRYDRSTLRTGGFAVTGGGAHGFFEAIERRLGVARAYQPYGMTEVNAMAIHHALDEPFERRVRPGGTPAPGLEARVMDPATNVSCSEGVAGELQLRGSLVSRGYWQKPEETAAAFTADGWFRTGDLAVRHSDGDIVFTGRLRETLRISHFMVAPGEIEAFLMSHPDVLQAFVVGVPDARTTEAPVAFVIRRPGAVLTEDELRAWCHGKLASFKIPCAVHFVSDVPRTPGPHGDKVQRGKLRELALAQPHGEERSRR